MKKVLILALMLVVLAGCGDNTTKKESTSTIFKNEILAVSKIDITPSTASTMQRINNYQMKF